MYIYMCICIYIYIYIYIYGLAPLLFGCEGAGGRCDAAVVPGDSLSLPFSRAITPSTLNITNLSTLNSKPETLNLKL